MTAYLSVGEEEHHVFALHPSHLIEPAQIFVETVIVVTSTQLDLEAAVGAHVGGKACEGLLAAASYTHQQGVAPLLADHPGDPVEKQ